MSSLAAAPSTTSLLARWAAELTLRRVVTVLVLSALVAALLNPRFVTPFPVVLGRSVFVGMMLLLAFAGAGLWSGRWLPRWLVQVLAVALVAPLATFVAYLFRVDGDIAVLLGHEGLVSGFFSITLTALMVGIVVALGALYRARDAQARAAELQFALDRATLERQAADARLALLHAQIEPHFMFNTLANVQALVESGSDRAAPVLRHLIAYLRAAMPSLNDADTTLATELRLVRAYLELMHLRLPDRLRFEIDVAPELMALRFPTMALLTLVENAVRHGIDPSEEGGSITVAGRVGADRRSVTLSVADTGLGIADDAPAGVGLANLRSRLAGWFGDDARLDLDENTPRGVRAVISFVLAEPLA